MEVDMISARTDNILKFIVGQYITKAVPVPSQSIATDSALAISPATIRNEMAQLEKEGYITRAHPSAGSIPSDKGYRYYVESLRDVMLSLTEQRLISHLFHQVERELGRWLSLAATLLAQQVRNVAVVTVPRSTDCRFKYLELVNLQGTVALVVLVLQGAQVKEQLVIFDRVIAQSELTTVANKLSAACSGLTWHQITARDLSLSPIEQQVTDLLLNMMKTEDEQEYEESYLDGLHFILDQPEFTHSHKMLGLMELVEHRNLLRSIMPEGLENREVQVIIGKENKEEAFHNYSIVISKYGVPDEAVGTISVLGPTRMPYAHTISLVGYLSSVLSSLTAGLYGRETPPGSTQHDTN